MFFFMVPTVITNNDDTRFIDNLFTMYFLPVIRQGRGIINYNRKSVAELLSITRAEDY